MVKSLDLAKINTLADSGAYGGYRVLSPTSAATVLCAGVWLSDLRNWQGAGYDLTEAEIDEIKELVAELQYEAMTESAVGVGDFVKIAETVHTADVAAPYVNDFDEGDWVLFRLVISGLMTDSDGIWADGVEIEYNDDQQNTSYASFNNFQYYTGQIKYQILKGYPANVMEWVCTSSIGDIGVWGNAEITIFAPLQTEFKGAKFSGIVPSFSTNQVVYTEGTHSIFIDEAITKILIRPFYGDTFLIGGANEPSELRMTVYGLK